jgi:nitroreductase
VVEIDVLEAIQSLRQFTRYKPDPVPREAIEKIIDAAVRAPSGGNNQPWEFIVITDRDVIAKLGQIYSDAWIGAFGPIAPPDESPVYRSARYLAQHMREVPAMILVCADHSRGPAPIAPGEPIVRGRFASSVFLAVENLFLAARALGLGTRLTTAHLRREDEVKALLGIPEHVETVTLIPLGYPRGSFGPATRRPAGEVTSWNHYGTRG